jgi:hypothetical protein
MKTKRGKLVGLKRSPYREEEYDSGLEKFYMLELEGMPGVKSWTKKHGIKIPYKLFFMTHHYHPDFLVEFQDGSKEIHETKGTVFLLWLSTRMKRRAAEDYCHQLGWKYKLVTSDKTVYYSRLSQRES